MYSLARGRATRVDLGTLGAVITTLEELTCEEVTPADLLRAVDVPVLDDETQGWLAASLEPPMEPYDWGDVDPSTLGQLSPQEYAPIVHALRLTFGLA